MHARLIGSAIFASAGFPAVWRELSDPEMRLDRLESLGYASYKAYLQSAHWRATKARYRASGLPQDCYCCGHDEVHLHHRTYKRIGAERLDDLVPLCRRCHTLVHVLERRGDVRLDLTGLLDATRAAQYAAQREPSLERASAESEADRKLGPFDAGELVTLQPGAKLERHRRQRTEARKRSHTPDARKQYRERAKARRAQRKADQHADAVALQQRTFEP